MLALWTMRTMRARAYLLGPEDRGKAASFRLPQRGLSRSSESRRRVTGPSFTRCTRMWAP